MSIRSFSPIRFLARAWFPLALIALLLLAIPGLVLFFLNVLGQQGPVNDWLEKNFHLSYHLALPGWGAVLLLLAPLAIVLLYFLKLKRKPLSVPSTFLWRKSIEDLHVNSLLQWLRENVLLLLQILTVLLLIYGVMGFHIHGHATEGAHYILMIDNSASMSATDVSPSRLEWARREALKEIDAHTENDFGMVIEFNSTAEIKQSYTGNRGLLRSAVEGIKETQRPTRIEEALSLADSLANPLRSTEDVASRPENEVAGKERTYVPPRGIDTDLHLFSDGRFPDLSETALANLNSRAMGNENPLGNLHLHFHMAGKPDGVKNVALVAFDALRDEREPSNYQVFLRAVNFGAEEVSAHVQLEKYVNGQLRDVYPEQVVTLPALSRGGEKSEKEQPPTAERPGEASVTFNLKDVDDRSDVVLHARVLSADDRLAVDNDAWRVIGVVRKARLLIVGPSNEVLDKFFFNNPAVEDVAAVKQVRPDYLGTDAYAKEARNGAYDLVIFDRCVPPDEKAMPRSNTFFIGRPPPPWNMDQAERIENPHIKGWMHDHPVMRYLAALHDVLVSEAFNIKDLPPHTPRLIETDHNATVLFTLSRGPFTDLVMTFPIIDDKGEYVTNWPLRPSFPIFLQNVLYSLGNVRDTATEETVQPGQVKTIRPDATVSKVTVVDPAGQEHPLAHHEGELRTDFTFGDTDQVGVYRVHWADGERSFAVNLLDPEESNIEPRGVIQIGSEQIAAGQEHGQPREVWKWFALAALAGLLLEWYIYNRRVYV